MRNHARNATIGGHNYMNNMNQLQGSAGFEVAQLNNSLQGRQITTISGVRQKKGSLVVHGPPQQRNTSTSYATAQAPLGQTQVVGGQSRKYETRTQNPSAQEDGSGKHQKTKTLNLQHGPLLVNPPETKVRLRQGQQQRSNVPPGAVRAQMAYDNKAKTAMQHSVTVPSSKGVKLRNQNQHKTMHNRGRSSGFVIQPGGSSVTAVKQASRHHPSMSLAVASGTTLNTKKTGSSTKMARLSHAANAKEIQKLIEMQQAQLAQAMASNPFKRPKQVKQKQWQAQAYNTQKASSSQQRTVRQDAGFGNMRSVSNCSGPKMSPQQPLRSEVGRKAPSSINILQHNQNRRNDSGNFQNVHLINASNMIQTHQQLPRGMAVQQVSQNLIRAPPREEISEAQVLESEEYFESGKIYLGERLYKDAAKMFTKSLQANKTNFDALFYRAVSHLDNEFPEKAIDDLEELLKICPDYRKTLFIVLSIAYRRVNDYMGAVKALSKAIASYPDYIEAYIARGQIYSFQKKWQQALHDFQAVLKQQPANGMGHLGFGDALKGLGRMQEAIDAYSQVIEDESASLPQGLMKRGLLYLNNRDNELALKDFDRLTEMAEKKDAKLSLTSLSKAYFYKAKALKKVDNMFDAVLYFEQVIRLKEDNFLAGSALYEIAKIKIQQKDFYEANYNLQRALPLNLRYKKLQNYRLFTEGVIFLMKRKTKTGVKLITQVIERMGGEELQIKEEVPDPVNVSDKFSDLPVNGEQRDYIFPLLFIYRAYGSIVTEEYESGLRDFQRSAQIKKLSQAQYYNMILCQGLKNLLANDYEQSITFFTRAAKMLSTRRDPYLLRGMAMVQYAAQKPLSASTKSQMLKDAKKDLTTALSHSPKDEQVLWLRGTLNFALHRFYDGIRDFERVIDKVDETMAAHYLARGRCYACLSMFREAITDLSIAINLNKDLLDAYLNRGKCAYLIGDTALAFMDFQKLIVLEPKNSQVHIYAGNLLMTTGSYEDATKAFTNANNIETSPLALYQRSRCHVALNNMEDALADLNKVLELSRSDKVASQDRECLNALMACSLQDGEHITDKQVFLKAAQTLSKLISHEKNPDLAKIIHESSIAHSHSQVIPSAHRTKIDKIRAIRRRKDQDRAMRTNPEAKKNDLRFRVNNQDDASEANEFEDISELDDNEVDRLNKKMNKDDSGELDQDSSDGGTSAQGEDANYYKENIFNKEDFLLYRAALQIFGGDHKKALADLEECSAVMHQNKVVYPRNGLNDDDDASANSSQTDLSDVGLCSLNIHEFTFNQVLCLLLAKEYKAALKKLDYVIQTIPKKYVGQLWLLRGVLNVVLRHVGQAEKDFARAFKYDAENARKFLKRGEDIQLPVFPQQQRLCSFFQYIDIDIPDFVSPFAENENRPKIGLKPSFSFPFIKPPNMIPCVDQAVLDNFKLKASGVTLKPEAPWIKKCDFGIKFTEEILYTDDDRESTPDEDKEYKKRKQRQQERALEGAGFIRAHSEKVVLRTNIFEEADPAGGEAPEGPAEYEDGAQEDAYYAHDDDADESYSEPGADHPYGAHAGDVDDYARFELEQLGGRDLRTKDSQDFVAAGSGSKARDSIDGGLPLGSQDSAHIGLQPSPNQNIDEIMANAQMRDDEIDIQDELEIDVGPDAQPPMLDDYVDSHVDKYLEDAQRPSDLLDFDDMNI